MTKTKLSRLRDAAAVVLLVLLVGCTGEADSNDGTSDTQATTTTQTEPGTETTNVEAEPATLIYAQTEDITNWDPTHPPVGDWVTMHTIYDVLVRLDESLEPESRLASNWSLSDDGLQFTLELREDVLFHDGSEFDAEAVIFNLDRYSDPEVGANIRGLMASIESWEATDSHTVTLNFSEKMPNVFDFLDLFFITAPISTDEINTNPVGTGPFVFESWTPGERALVSANENYWAGPPAVDAIEIRTIPDAQALIAALEAGEVHLIDAVPYTDIDRLRDSTDLTIEEFGQGGLIAHVLANTTVAPLDDQRVRLALNLALNRQRIVDTFFSGHSEPWCLPWPDSSLAFDSSLARECNQDLERARDLLSEAGYPDGFEVDMITRPGSAEGVAAVFQADLAEIGVQLNITPMSTQEAGPHLTEGDFELFGHQHARTNRDPLTAFGAARPFWPVGNFALFEDEQYQNLVAELRDGETPEDRASTLAEINELLREQSFSMTVAPIPRFFGLSPAVEGFATNVDGFPIFEGVTLTQTD